MKFSFSFSQPETFGDLQAKVSEALCIHLAAKKDFVVSFANEGTAKQLRGFYRICDILAPYMEESEGVFFDKDIVKEVVKQECNYCTTIKGKPITKSLAHASRDEMTAMIKKLYELGEFYEAKNFRLTSNEKQALAEFYEKN